MMSLESVLRQVSKLNRLADLMIRTGREAGFHSRKGFYGDPNRGLPQNHWLSDEKFQHLIASKPKSLF